MVAESLALEAVNIFEALAHTGTRKAVALAKVGYNLSLGFDKRLAGKLPVNAFGLFIRVRPWRGLIVGAKAKCHV